MRMAFALLFDGTCASGLRPPALSALFCGLLRLGDKLGRDGVDALGEGFGLDARNREHRHQRLVGVGKIFLVADTVASGRRAQGRDAVRGHFRRNDVSARVRPLP